MKVETVKRNAWVACPRCGHKVARVRTCDMEVKCRDCGFDYEVVIASTMIRNKKELSSSELAKN